MATPDIHAVLNGLAQCLAQGHPISSFLDELVHGGQALCFSDPSLSSSPSDRVSELLAVADRLWQITDGLARCDMYLGRDEWRAETDPSAVQVPQESPPPEHHPAWKELTESLAAYTKSDLEYRSAIRSRLEEAGLRVFAPGYLWCLPVEEAELPVARGIRELDTYLAAFFREDHLLARRGLKELNPEEASSLFDLSALCLFGELYHREVAQQQPFALSSFWSERKELLSDEGIFTAPEDVFLYRVARFNLMFLRLTLGLSSAVQSALTTEELDASRLGDDSEGERIARALAHLPAKGMRAVLLTQSETHHGDGWGSAVERLLECASVGSVDNPARLNAESCLTDLFEDDGHALRKLTARSLAPGLRDLRFSLYEWVRLAVWVMPDFWRNHDFMEERRRALQALQDHPEAHDGYPFSFVFALVWMSDFRPRKYQHPAEFLPSFFPVIA